ncbi:MAG: GNAT family N-acetyltransferase [Rhizomicrobium sp.]|jgi:GNAT superfamily N-acetyltransferase
MRQNLSIRRAAATDAVETAAAFSAALHSMDFFPKLHSDEEDIGFVRRLIEDAETWVAIEDGRIAGLAAIRCDWLEQLYLHPSFHNRGIGTALLAKVKQERPAGFQLWTFQANAGARRFYERHGFVAVEFTDGSRNEEKLPDIRYVWRGGQHR